MAVSWPCAFNGTVDPFGATAPIETDQVEFVYITTLLRFILVVVALDTTCPATVTYVNPAGSSTGCGIGGSPPFGITAVDTAFEFAEVGLAVTVGASGVVELTTVKVAGLEVALPALERATDSKRYPL